MGKVNKKPFRRDAEETGKSKPKPTLTLKNPSSPTKCRITKKVKRMQKKRQFIDKLTSIQQAKDKIKEAKRKSQTPVVGNMDPLLDALNQISQHEYTKKKEVGSVKVSKPGKKKIASQKKRIKSDLNDIALFKKVTSHPKYQANPVSAISDHVKYLMEQE